MRGSRRIVRGDYERGIADLQTAVRLDPNDPAATFEAWPKASLAAADLQHGEEQVRRMLKDRPAMDRHGKKASLLHMWAAQAISRVKTFNNGFCRDPTDPPPWTNADNLPPTAEHPGSIRVNKSYGSGPDATKEWSFEGDGGASAVFELYRDHECEGL